MIGAEVRREGKTEKNWRIRVTGGEREGGQRKDGVGGVAGYRNLERREA